jgi:hypothetical protein
VLLGKEAEDGGHLRQMQIVAHGHDWHLSERRDAFRSR